MQAFDNPEWRNDSIRSRNDPSISEAWKHMIQGGEERRESCFASAHHARSAAGNEGPLKDVSHADVPTRHGQQRVCELLVCMAVAGTVNCAKALVLAGGKH